MDHEWRLGGFLYRWLVKVQIRMKTLFFRLAVRTGEAGMKGVSLLLIERTMQGVSTR